MHFVLICILLRGSADGYAPKRVDTALAGGTWGGGGYADILATRYARLSAGRDACYLLSPLFHADDTRLLMPRPRYAVVRVLFSRFPRWVRFVAAMRRRTASTQSLEGRRRDGHVVIAAKLVAGDKRGMSTTRGSPKVAPVVRIFVVVVPRVDFSVVASMVLRCFQPCTCLGRCFRSCSSLGTYLSASQTRGAVLVLSPSRGLSVLARKFFVVKATLRRSVCRMLVATLHGLVFATGSGRERILV